MSADPHNDRLERTHEPPGWSPSPLRRLVRHRGAYWTISLVLAGLAALGVHGVTADARKTLDRLGPTSVVLVAHGPIEPGDVLADATIEREVPVGLLPEGALDRLPPEAVAARTIPAGAVLTGHDVSTEAGPSSTEAAIAVPLSSSTPPTAPGARVVLILAGDAFAGIDPRLVDGRVLHLGDDRITVAVARADLADTAAALRLGLLTLAAA